MSESTTRKEVVAVAKDESWWNKEPAVVRGAVVGTVGAVATVAVIAGWIPLEQKQVIEDNAGTLVLVAFALVPVAQGLWTRIKAFAPKTAAEIAIVNTDAAFAAGKAGEAKPAPTLLSPP